MSFVVKNVCKANLPVKGTGAIIIPGAQIDLCILLNASVDDVRARSDVSRWLETNRLQLIDSDLKAELAYDKLDEEVLSRDELEENQVVSGIESGTNDGGDDEMAQLDPRLDPSDDLQTFADDNLETLSNKELRLKCTKMGLQPPRSRADKIKLIRSVTNESLGDNGVEE